MVCGICKVSKDKYKCPKCLIPYCSLLCFKSENHKHEESESNDEPEVKNSKPTDTVSLQNSESSIDLKWVTAFKDPIIRSMLRSDALQIHLVTIMKILKEPQFTNSTNLEETKEVALLKLTNLRHPNGIEANEIVEEFINRLLLLI